MNNKFSKMFVMLGLVVGFSIIGTYNADASVIIDPNTNEQTEVTVTDENGNVVEDIEITVEKVNPLTRGFSLSKKVSITKSNAQGIFAKSLYYQESGNKNMKVQYAGTLYYHSAKPVYGYQYTFWVAAYNGTVYGWTN